MRRGVCSNSNDQAIWQWNSEVMNAANEENLIIDVDYTYDTNNFFDTQEKKDVFEETINEIAARLGDDLASIDPSNLSVNTWDMVFTHPGTGNRATLTDQIIEANTLRIFVGGAPLGGTTLGRGGSGGYSVSGFSDFLDSVTTDINLSSTSIDENVPTNSTVGTFSTTDSTGETFTYTLISGEGDTDNNIMNRSQIDGRFKNNIRKILNSSFIPFAFN